MKPSPHNFRLRSVAGYVALFSQLMFLLVLTPMHTRGAMRVDGNPTGGGETNWDGGCCQRDKKKSPTASDRAACAVCYVTARLDTATPTTVSAPEPQLIAVTDVVSIERGISLPAAAVYDGRAPPM